MRVSVTLPPSIWEMIGGLIGHAINVAVAATIASFIFKWVCL